MSLLGFRSICGVVGGLWGCWVVGFMLFSRAAAPHFLSQTCHVCVCVGGGVHIVVAIGCVESHFPSRSCSQQMLGTDFFSWGLW